MNYIIEVYKGPPFPGNRPYRVEHAATHRDARHIAARMLGHRTLRGANRWERYEGGPIWLFGPRYEESGFDYVTITEVER